MWKHCRVSSFQHSVKHKSKFKDGETEAGGEALSLSEHIDAVSLGIKDMTCPCRASIAVHMLKKKACEMWSTLSELHYSYCW